MVKGYRGSTLLIKWSRTIALRSKVSVFQGFAVKRLLFVNCSMFYSVELDVSAGKVMGFCQ